MTDTNEKKTLVYQSVFADIIRRQYSHQSIITEKMLIDKYNLSKSPVREALIQLCSDGILESLPRIGYRIIPLSMKDLSDALTLRLLIETKALEYSFPNINENKINTLKVLQQEKESIVDVKDVYVHWELNVRFHITLASFSNNKYFTQTLMSLMKTCFRGVYGYYENFWEEGDNKGNMPYHEMLIEALENRDLEESIKILKTDISDLKSYISLSLQSMGSI
ncbi:GntR family transcriptional regulator [Spirochaetales bacterium NM-380-WT-3C1]|uniref:GntR family transcriptional regulator n=1 Tax=Bullifex porci TaxID=2606638 RepID=A0A7X2TQG3_9SPIO|nr:GntR family transcriptional regulator [Bullifex porci]MSU05782.1 GntR family transcriptional regulator [Bullifex porci]